MYMWYNCKNVKYLLINQLFIYNILKTNDILYLYIVVL